MARDATLNQTPSDILYHVSVEDRKKTINHRLSDLLGNTVQSGPFQGMLLLDPDPGNIWDYSAKLLGTYENEMAPFIEQIIEMNPQAIVNIGSADGFYTVGFAYRLPGTPVFSFESEPDKENLTQKLAKRNGVSEQIVYSGTCTPSTLSKTLSSLGKTAILSDCQGYEYDLIDPRKIPSLKQSILLIEGHDRHNTSTNIQIADRFAKTHLIKRVEEGARDPNQFSAMKNWNSLDRWLAICEFRNQTSDWLFGIPR